MRRQTAYVHSITVGAAEHWGGSEVESPRRFEFDDQPDPSRTAAPEGRIGQKKAPLRKRGQFRRVRVESFADACDNLMNGGM